MPEESKTVINRACPPNTQCMQWISIKDKQPADGEEVITFFYITGIEIAIYKNLGRDMFYKGGYLTDDVTHWMPLPKQPTRG